MAVYCGASLGNEPIYQQAAVALAAWMKEITMISLWRWQCWSNGHGG